MAASALTLQFEDVQGIVLWGYGRFLGARFLLLRVEDPVAARAWLADRVEAVGRADRFPAAYEEPGTAMQLAFTHEGLRQLGLPKIALDRFAIEFQEGMAGTELCNEVRSRALGDVDQCAPSQWSWGGEPSQAPHALLMLYADSDRRARRAADAERAKLAASGLSEVQPSVPAPLTLRDKMGVYEHFGFNDGVGQPTLRCDNPPDDPPVMLRRGPAWNAINPGELLLGYPNQYDKRPQSPHVAHGEDPNGLLPDRDFGSNGSYLVYRQLAQDVPSFWRYARRHDPRHPERFATCLVGRWPSGAPLVLAPDRDRPELGKEDGFTYRDTNPERDDTLGHKVPIGSHARRANPRDGMGDTPHDSIRQSNLHRIVRRARPYGKPITKLRQKLWESSEPTQDDGVERGLHFLCLNADLRRQFEFLQETWLNGPEFAGLHRERDPLVGWHVDAGDTFTRQGEVRTRHEGLSRFVTVRGGAYFFLPGIRALRYLAAGPPAT